MELMLSAEQLKYKEYCRRFAAEKLVPISQRYGETDDIPQEMVREMAEAGFFKLFLPPDMGGNGAMVTPLCLAREQIAGVYCPADVTLAMQGLGSYPICLAGNASQKKKYLPKIAGGEWLITFALTEPEAGSDVNGIKSEARQTPGGFVLNGKKRFISNGYAANVLTVFAKTPSPDNPRSISAFILEKEMQDVRVSKRLRLMAPHDIVELEFDDCFVPNENLLGKTGDGYRIAMRTLDVFRVSVGASALGMGKTAFDSALTYAKKRVQFGSPIAKFQAIQLKLADMATDLDAAKALIYRAALLKDKEAPNTARYASMAKYHATEAASRVIDQAVQIHGGMGLVRGATVERLYREIRALRIYEGTSEIQKLIIADTYMKDHR
jgi:acyl-CoA dehydrogenase